jgi:hypothetical protein
VKINPKMIVPPPQSSLGEKQSATLIAQDLHPGLQFLPLQEWKEKGEPIPTTWPNLKIERIPTNWPNVKMLPVQTDPDKASGK